MSHGKNLIGCKMKLPCCKCGVFVTEDNFWYYIPTEGNFKNCQLFFCSEVHMDEYKVLYNKWTTSHLKHASRLFEIQEG